MSYAIFSLIAGAFLFVSALDKRHGSFQGFTRHLGMALVLVVSPAIFCTHVLGQGAWLPIVLGGAALVAGCGLMYGLMEPTFNPLSDKRGWADVTLDSARNLENSIAVWCIALATFGIGGFFWGAELLRAYHVYWH